MVAQKKGTGKKEKAAGEDGAGAVGSSHKDAGHHGLVCLVSRRENISKQELSSTNLNNEPPIPKGCCDPRRG